MIIAFANNQAINANGGTTSAIYTDPVPMGDNDRASAIFNVAYCYGPTNGTLAYQGEVSNDGTNWLSVTGLTDSATDATTTPKQVVKAVNGAFIRFKYTLAAVGSGTAAANFDLHVLLDHA